MYIQPGFALAKRKRVGKVIRSFIKRRCSIAMSVSVFVCGQHVCARACCAMCARMCARGRDCSSRLSLTLHRKSCYTPTFKLRRAWRNIHGIDRLCVRCYRRCVVDATCTYTYEHITTFQRREYRAIALFLEHCHDRSRCRNAR